MATVFAAIGTSLAGAGGATAAAGAAGSAIVALSQGLSVLSALSAIGQGISTKRRLETEAAFARAQAVQEEAKGAAEARDLAREYAELTGEQKVIQLANGLDVGVGTPVSVRESTKALNERNLDVTRQTASNRAAMQRLRARGLMSEAKASLLGGFGSAAQIGVNALQLTG